jgi:hypothetical protein
MRDRARVYAALLVLGCLALGLLWWATRDDEKGAKTSGASSFSASASTAAQTSPPRELPDAMAAWQAMGGAVDGGTDAKPLSPAEERLANAQQVLTNYRTWARYPPQSRPLSENADVQTTYTGSSRKQLFVRKDGVKRGDVIVRVSQSTAFVTGDETISFEVTCEGEGRTLPCAITRAEAARQPNGPSDPASAEVPVRFADDGQPPDAKAADATFAALLKPSSTALAGKDGRIGVAVTLRYQSDEGQVFFQFDYTAAEPARFTGKVTEALENGSLALDLEMEVTKPGRYVLAARVDDANGNGFAYLDHNAELAAGTTKARFLVFGKLVKDQKAVAPFKLRDLSGFLLKENTSPDREVLEPIPGPFYTTKAYKDADFADAEWQSDEKQRHLTEFTKDVNEAQAALAGTAAAPSPATSK